MSTEAQDRDDDLEHDVDADAEMRDAPGVRGEFWRWLNGWGA